MQVGTTVEKDLASTPRSSCLNVRYVHTQDAVSLIELESMYMSMLEAYAGSFNV